MNKLSRETQAGVACPTPDLKSFVLEIWLPQIRASKHSWRVDERISRQHILPFLGDLSLAAISSDTILDWLAGFDEKKFTVSTRNRILCVLKAIFKAAARMGFLDGANSPLQDIHCAPEQRRAAPPLDKSQAQTLLEKLNANTRPEAGVIALLLLTDASKNEILTARWENLDRKSGTLIAQAQSGKRRNIPLSQAALKVIDSLERHPDCQWLFPGKDRKKPISHIFPFWNQLRNECGLAHLRIQDLRYNGQYGESVFFQSASGMATASQANPPLAARRGASARKRNAAQAGSIAIIGMGLRFPGNVRDEQSMWETLAAGRACIGRIPSGRWEVDQLEHPQRSEAGRSVTFAAGILDNIDMFDPSFFKISPREAAWMDPQQRILLELAHEAMEDAGIRPETLAGGNCGVYVGISGMDYGQHALADLASMSPHTMTGNTLSIAANRLSYVYNLHGPSLAMDTACSSSLAAVHQACQALRQGEIPVALAGGINLLMHPYSFIGFSHASMLSATGQCRPFDARGDGYVRGEGGALLLLKPLDQALRDGDHIHAVILASGINSDGARKNGLTIPSRAAQTALMRDVLAASGLKRSQDVDFVEAHGTGTQAGDPVEAESIGSAYGHGRSTPVPISSAKANFGHLEPASGMVGLIKAILTLKHGRIPPMPVSGFTPNPHIDFAGFNVECVVKGKTLEKHGGRPLTGGVNSFGFGGLNAHIILRGHEKTAISQQNPAEIPPLFISAQSDEALKELALAWVDLLGDGQNYYTLAYNAAFNRSRMDRRLAVWPDTPASAAETLKTWARGEQARDAVCENALVEPGGIAFVYSGNGSQWLGMGRDLYAESPAFASILGYLDEHMHPLLGFSIIEKLEHGGAEVLEYTSISQPLLFAIQVGITTILRDLGVKPAAATGHSVGEVAAAWAAGALSLPQAIRVIYARSVAQHETYDKGRMAAVAISAETARTLLTGLGLQDKVEIAASNSPSNCTLAGNGEALRALEEHFKKENIFFRMLDLKYAFHTSDMESVKDDLKSMLGRLDPVAESEALFISAVTGTEIAANQLNTGYWWRNIREAVNFSGAIQELAARGMRVFVEIGPHAVLQRYMRENLAAVGVEGRIMPSLQRGNSGIRRLRNVAAALHLLGEGESYPALFPYKAPRARLPLYPWQRQRCWYPRTSECRPLMRAEHRLLGWRLPGVDPVWENILDPRKDQWLRDHKVGGVIVFAAAAYVELALEAARIWLGKPAVALENLDIRLPLVFEGAQTVRCALNTTDGTFRILSRPRLDDGQWVENARCRLILPAIEKTRGSFPELAENCQELEATSLYELTTDLGLDYGPTFRRIKRVRFADDKIEGMLTEKDDNEFALEPAVLDACFHSLVALYANGNPVAFLPVGAARIETYETCKIVKIQGRLKPAGPRMLKADFEMLDADGQVAARARGCRFRQAPGVRNSRDGIDAWQTSAIPAPLPGNGRKAELPANSILLETAINALKPLERERSLWFKEILPRLEAATLAGIAEGRAGLSENQPETAFGAWTRALLANHDLLDAQEEKGAILPSWREIWNEAYAMAPHFLPALLPVARVLRRLPKVLAGEIRGEDILSLARNEVIASENSGLNPAYAGMDIAIDAILRKIAAERPQNRKLSILELAAYPAGGDAQRALADGCIDYHVILPENGNGVSTRVRPPEPGKEGDGEHDVIILRHILHQSDNLSEAVARIRALLAPDGLVILCERHADWSADLLAGLEPDWWHTGENGDAISSRIPPDDWKTLFESHGFRDCQIFTEPAADGLEEGAWLFLARNGEPGQHTPQTRASTWLLLADKASVALAESLADQLENMGQKVETLLEPDASLQGFENIVFMRGHADTPDTAVDTLAELSSLARASMAMPAPARFWLVTCGGGLADEAMPNPAQATVTGFGRVMQSEWPGLRAALLNLEEGIAVDDASQKLLAEFMCHESGPEVLLGSNSRHVVKIMPRIDIGYKETERYRLDIPTPGRLDNLVWRGDTAPKPAEGWVEARVMATGLNFRDVMLSMGLLPEDALENGFAGPTLGLEFSGVISAVGSGVTNLAVGDRVAGFAPACFSSHVLAPEGAITHIPDSLDFFRAASVPTIFITAWYALKHLAGLAKGETILIHGGAGGVGIAAIQIARMLGAQVHVTAGSPEKRDFLRELGVDNVYDSRNLDFADEILKATGGKGVDVVLNSLAGEAMRRSVALLKPFGRFLELGKRDYVENTAIGLRPFKENISYFSIDVDQLLTARPELASRLFREVMEHLAEGRLLAPPHRVFSADRVKDAFRTMQQSRHIGKIVVDMSGAPKVSMEKTPTGTLDFSGTWLVSGGLGGFGLETARHLARNGVKSLVLASRRGLATPGAELVQKEFTEQGIRILVAACDFTRPEEVKSLVERIGREMEPLRGIVHAAAIFDDRLLRDMDRDAIENSIKSKFAGAWNLHLASMGLDLKYFVVYSSISVALGNPGQANYVAANAGLEAIVRLRERLGLPAAAIAWGPIGDVGYLARNEAVRKSLAARLGRDTLTASQAMAAFNQALLAGGISILANVNWRQALGFLEDIPARFSQLVAMGGEMEGHEGAYNLKVLLADMDSKECLAELNRLIREEAARVLGVDSARIIGNKNLQSLGLDSLMAMDLAMSLEQRAGISIPPMLLHDAPTVDQLAQRLLERLTGEKEGTASEDDILAELGRRHSEVLPGDLAREVISATEGAGQ